MRGMLMHREPVSYLVAVEYLVRESGAFDNGGLTEWEGTFVPDLPLTLTGTAYVLELEDGRRGAIEVTAKQQSPNSPDAPVMYRFVGRSVGSV